MDVDVGTTQSSRQKWLQGVAAEPFRWFFPWGVLVSMVGVLVWPLHLWNILGPYPGPAHMPLMVDGFFGAFIVGFAGTAGPRLLGVAPFSRVFTGCLAALHAAMAAAFVVGEVALGNGLFLLLLVIFAAKLIQGIQRRTDAPPPGIVLVGFGLVCGSMGALMSVGSYQREVGSIWSSLQRSLSYQAFPLFPILGVAPFLVPRFFGVPSSHEFPESGRLAPPGWWQKAFWGLGVGLALVVTFVLESMGWVRFGNLLKTLVVAAHLWRELPLHRFEASGNRSGRFLQAAFALVLLGFLGVAAFPLYRIAMLHFALMGGFVLVTLIVGMRVVLGHNDALEHWQSTRFRRWWTVALAMILLGMWTRISGDFWPKIQRTHYSYGALLWILGTATWAWNLWRTR